MLITVDKIRPGDSGFSRFTCFISSITRGFRSLNLASSHIYVHTSVIVVMARGWCTNASHTSVTVYNLQYIDLHNVHHASCHVMSLLGSDCL